MKYAQHSRVGRMIQPRRLAILALVASTSIASAQEATIHVVQSSPNERVMTHWTQAISTNDAFYDIKYKDGVYVVKINGENMPSSWSIKEGKNISILDENGKEVIEFYGSPGADPWATADAEHEITVKGRVNVAYEQPKVMLGVNLSEPGVALRKHLQLGDRQAILIEGVIDGLPAQKAGLEQYDVVVSIDGSDEASREVLSEAMAKHEAGDVLELVVLRAGSTLTIKPELMSYDAEALGTVMVNVEVGGENSDTVRSILIDRIDPDGKLEVLVEHLRERDFPRAGGMNPPVFGKHDFFELRDDGQLFIRSQKQKLDAERAAILSEWNALKGEHAQRLHEMGNDRLEALETRLAGLEDEMEVQMDRIEDRMEKLTGLLERMFEKLSEDDE